MFKIIEYITIFIVGIDLYLVFRTLLGIIWRKRYNDKINGLGVIEYPNLVIILPALREQPLVKSTMAYFSKLEYPQDKLKIILATTQREENEYKLNNQEGIETTSFLIKKEIEESNYNSNYEKFVHIHYPYNIGNKSSQMNYAIEQYIDKYKDINSEKTYVVVYDFDSMPSDETFIQAAKISNNYNYPDVLQQVPLNLKNFNELSNDYKNSMILLQGLHHTIRSIGIELFRLLLSTLNLKFIPFYCIGAGMFIRLDSLVKFDKFPKVVDDITLGYKYTISKLRFIPIPSYNLVELPHKVKLIFNQRVLIFKGILSSFEEGKKGLKEKKSIQRILLIFMEGLLNTLSSTVFPWIVLGFLLFSIILNNFNWLFWVAIITPYLWTIVALIALHSLGLHGKYKKSSIFLTLLISPIWKLCKTFSAWIYIKRFLVSKITNTEIVFRKTDRK